MVVVLLGLAGCTGHEDGVRRAADAWAGAVEAGDWQAACDLLAPPTVEELEQSAQKPCAEALPEEASPPEGEPRAVEVYGAQGQVEYAGETVFVAQFGERWQVWAASCTFTKPSRPYECKVKGG